MIYTAPVQEMVTKKEMIKLPLWDFFGKSHLSSCILTGTAVGRPHSGATNYSFLIELSQLNVPFTPAFQFNRRSAMC